MLCPTCNQAMKGAKGTHHYVECGLSNVYLREWELFECPEGHASIPLLRSAKAIAQIIAWAVIRLPGRLDGDTILFLRKAMGQTATDLAHELGVNRVEVSRWENNHVRISDSSDFKLRMAAAQRVVPEHLRNETKLEVTDLIMRRREGEPGRPIEYITVLPEMVKQFDPVVNVVHA